MNNKKLRQTEKAVKLMNTARKVGKAVAYIDRLKVVGAAAVLLISAVVILRR